MPHESVQRWRRSLVADVLLGSVTRQVLARSHADVLVLPRWRTAPAPRCALAL
jgi:nucleotide-binding universal stress UspA family protein